MQRSAPHQQVPGQTVQRHETAEGWLAGYRPVRVIGRGGMAELFLAVQTGLAGFSKLVVVKRILPHLCHDGTFVQMLLAEARLAASLTHPNIIQTLDVRRDAETFAVIMEYLPGEDLRYLAQLHARRRRRIPVPILCRILADAAAGLDAAHRATDAEGRSKEIVHRDVSPSNIMTTYHGVTKVLDFGVAKANVHHIYTDPGLLKGKLGYASPEQIRHEDLDARSDVFSLGVVAHELLSGRRLFGGETAQAALQAVMEREIQPPSRFNPAVGPELDRVVLAALQRDRAQRTASARLFRTQLEGLLRTVDHPPTSHDVGAWLRETCPTRYEKRLALERKGARITGEIETSLNSLQPMFSLSTSLPARGHCRRAAGSAAPPPPPPVSALFPASCASPTVRWRSRPLLRALVGSLALVALLLSAYLFGSWQGRSLHARADAPPANAPPADAPPADTPPARPSPVAPAAVIAFPPEPIYRTAAPVGAEVPPAMARLDRLRVLDQQPVPWLDRAAQSTERSSETPTPSARSRAASE